LSLPKESPFHSIDPKRILIESEHAIAFLDGYPVSKGHTLVVPRKIVTSIFQLDETIRIAIFEFTATVRELLEERYHPDGFNIGINDGPAAGQTISHAHIHIIPRYEGDVPDPRGGVRWVVPEKARYWDG